MVASCFCLSGPVPDPGPQGRFRLASPETRKTGLQPRLLQHHSASARHFDRGLVRSTVNAMRPHHPDSLSWQRGRCRENVALFGIQLHISHRVGFLLLLSSSGVTSPGLLDGFVLIPFSHVGLNRFYGPWYNCSKSSFDDSALPDEFNIGDFVPAAPSIARGGKNFIYKSKVDDASTQYARPYKDYNAQAYTGQGIFRGDPDIWLAFVENTTIPAPGTRWKFQMVPVVWRCVHQRAKYAVQSRWSSNRLVNRTATVSEGKALLAPGQQIGPRTGSMQRYKEFTGYYAVGSIMRKILSGDLVQDGPEQREIISGVAGVHAHTHTVLILGF